MDFAIKQWKEGLNRVVILRLTVNFFPYCDHADEYIFTVNFVYAD